MAVINQIEGVPSGKSRDGRRSHIDIRAVEIHYMLPEVAHVEDTYDELSDRWHRRTVVTRPEMQLTTVVNLCRNRFGVVRQYGPQGQPFQIQPVKCHNKPGLFDNWESGATMCGRR